MAHGSTTVLRQSFAPLKLRLAIKVFANDYLRSSTMPEASLPGMKHNITNLNLGEGVSSSLAKKHRHRLQRGIKLKWGIRVACQDQ
ncbi:hypothetical protein AVEN_88441-1 [Araneus ventricosus]|uniref:Uncharacterized protein n=1 Tax=Araneus ventricosus TaxID=182803 RepID=A0A4Y2LAK6_ARAVE|nr:hypothetical protein AVEN_88441-1 [Araneus ventricosus]